MKTPLQKSVKFFQKGTNFRKCLLASVLLGSGLQQSNAQTYPFPLPSTVSATLNVQTQNKETFNNLLLGNNLMGYTTTTEKDLFRRWDPITVRFPAGLWSNWYDWTNDQTRVFGTDSFQYIFQGGPTTKTATIDYLTSIKQLDNGNVKTGIVGLTSLNTERKNANSGKGYDMLWTFNMSADGTNFNQSPQTVARYNDLISKGFEVKAIEMGNECFYPGQRSSIIPNAAEYIARAKNMSQSLKAIDPTIKVSIPLLRRGSHPNPNWNADLTQDLSYFDAITVHTYIGSNPDDPTTSDNSYGTALTARNGLETSTNDFARVFAPNKPVWLSEWGVKSGGPNAASVLGMADCYLFMGENQNIYERANWFSVNGKLNSFYVWEDYLDGNGVTKSRIKVPYTKTAYGSTYEILRSVFENSTLLESDMATVNIDGTVKAVSGRAVTKNGNTTVFLLNMTDKPADFILKFDDINYSNSFKHEAMKFTSLSQESELPLDSNPLTLVKQGTGTITLPPLSINVISNLTVPTLVQLPYTTAKNIPGSIIEAEDYDKGGQGVAYHDTGVANIGNVYRTDGVDIGSIPGGYCVGWTSNGEWMEYRVRVLTSGNYNMNITYSAGLDGAKIGASFPDEGITLFSNLDLVKTTGGYNGYAVRTKYGIPLTAGYHTLRISIDQRGFNLDKIEFVAPIARMSNLKDGEKTELDESNSNVVVVYPNPSTTGVFTISEAGSWKVYNLSGVTVLEGKGDKIDLSGFAKGMYALKTESAVLKLIFN